ncbi:hypothetical protein ACH36K_05030 [Clostridium sp. MB05]|uniref:hypothetical protein n=1 Tax=Clostridium sp. MB05 TaxID=3376682 RepID=UPI003982D1EC
MEKFSMENIYKRCINSELELEEMVMKKTGLHKYFSFVIPRSVKFTEIKENKIQWTIIFYIASILWWIILFPTLELYKLGKFLILKLEVKNNENLLDGDIVLGLSPRIYNLEKRVFINVDYRIDFPWVNESEITKDEKSIDFLSLITYKDIFRAFKNSLTKAKGSIKKDYDITARLLTYSAFEWFLVYDVLDRQLKNCKTLYFCNQYDRWIHLIDNINISGEKVLIQHGVVVPFKIKEVKNISKIYCFNENQKDIFRDSIFINCKDICFENIPLSIDLSEKVSSKNSILIIGQPFSVDMEKKIVKELLDNNINLHIYIKPHPRFGVSLYNSLKDEVNIITDNKFYPRVDLALAYESTLGLEYEASGVNVIWIKNKKSKSVVSEIISFFDKKGN